MILHSIEMIKYDVCIVLENNHMYKGKNTTVCKEYMQRN